MIEDKTSTFGLVDTFFEIKEKGSSVKTEFIAALSTFSTLSFILFINPTILSKAGMDFSAALFATLITSAIATFSMAFMANYPFALAPSMGLNAYFAYTIVLGEGFSWQEGLGICFLAGVILIFLNLIGLRQLLMNSIPPCLRISVTGGIGLFLAFIGLQDLGVIEMHEQTLLSAGDLLNWKVGLGALTLLSIITMRFFHISGAILYSILSVWVLGLFIGLSKWKGLVDLPPDPSPTFFQLDLSGALNPGFLSAALSFVFVSLFEATGSFVALAEQGGFLDAEGKLPRAKKALFSDGLGAVVGSWTGTSPLTTYLESAAGIAAGGRTGLTAFFVGVFFLVSLFFSPLVESIPIYATAPVLIVIGSLMLEPVSRLNWSDPTESIPAYLTLVTIPLTFSIATGIMVGFIVYPIAKLLTGKIKETKPVIWWIFLFFVVKLALSL